MKSVLVLTSLLLLLAIPQVSKADEDGLFTNRITVSLRLGDFSSNTPWWANDFSAGLEVTRYIGDDAAVSIAAEAFEIGFMSEIVPLTFSYKWFPNGNSTTVRSSGIGILPWFGGGVGLHIRGHGDVIDVGGHIGGGVVIPLSNFFEFGADIRHLFNDNYSLTAYGLSLGVRF